MSSLGASYGLVFFCLKNQASAITRDLTRPDPAVFALLQEAIIKKMTLKFEIHNGEMTPGRRGMRLMFWPVAPWAREDTMVGGGRRGLCGGT